MKIILGIIGLLVIFLGGMFINSNLGDGELIQNGSQKTVIDLSYQSLTKVPEDIFRNDNTEELDLSHNQLTGSLPAEVRHMSSLKILKLNNNQFTGVPAEIGQLSHLEILDLSNNQLTGLPHELGNLSKLKFLDVSGNNYSEQDLSVIRDTLPDSTEIMR